MPRKRSSEKRKSTSVEVLFCVFRRLYRIFIQIKMTYHYFWGEWRPVLGVGMKCMGEKLLSNLKFLPIHKWWVCVSI